VKPTTLLLLLAVATAACTGTSSPTAPDPTNSVRVVQVLDGDSIVAEVDGDEVEVRLLGINTPERDECFDAEAKARTRELTGDAVVLDGGETDRFGRLLRYAYSPDGALLNQQLVAEGFALALTNDHPLLSEFKTAEAAAWDARIGLWQPDACGPAADASISVSRLEFDAPGDDSRNQNGEFAEIRNDGEAAADLTGWVLRDESSSHRFAFPSGFILEPGDRVRVFSGCGDPSPDEQYFCDGDPVWSNSGDTAYLLDNAGNVAARFGF